MLRYNPYPRKLIAIAILWVLTVSAWAQQESKMPNTDNRLSHNESALEHDQSTPPTQNIKPAIPEGMTLDEAFDYAESPPPANYPQTVPDDRLYVFTLFDKLEYRMATDNNTSDELGWEAQGWIGDDFNKFWWKNEGKTLFDGSNEGETETDLLYSRLITPFWYFQVGVQYANQWNQNDYNDRWSGAIALQGLAPYKFELTNSLYISQDGDVTFNFEAEYSIRIIQRLVLQPRAALGFAFQDILERDLGVGMTDAKLDLRLRYEIKREFAPYIGVRYQTLIGDTKNIAEAAGVKTEQLFLLAGLRFAF